MAGAVERVYAPLYTRHLRLLQLLKGSYEEPLRATIFHAELDKSTELEYDALSYSWGPSGPTHNIQVNGQLSSITENLDSALRGLRHTHEDRVLWVDAVCINQIDYEEKANQIQLIPTIYQKARDVIVFLGPPTPRAELIFGYMHQFENELIERGYTSLPASDGVFKNSWEYVRHRMDGCKNSATEQLQKSMISVLSHEWFYRAWVLQDVFVAHSVKIVCASTAVSAYILRKTVSLLGVHPHEHVSNVLEVLPSTVRRDSTAPKQSLYALLSKFKDSQCFNQRDHVCSLLHMVSDEDALNFDVDYCKSVQEVFQDTIAHILRLPHLNKKALPEWNWEEFKPNLESLGDKIVLWAAENGRLETLQHLYKAGIDINAMNEDGKTPLMLASDRGHSEIVQYLMKHGADEVSETLVSISDTASEPQSTIFSASIEGSSNLTSELYNAAAVTSTAHPDLTAWSYNDSFGMEKEDVKQEDDIQSVVSLDDDIASQAESSSVADQHRQAAVECIAMQFTSQNDLLGLYRESCHRLDEERFVHNHRRLLKSLFVDLQHGGQRPSEKAAIQFLRSRRKRNDVCRTIRHIVLGPREVVVLMKQKDDKKLMLNRFLEESDARDHLNMSESTSFIPELPESNASDNDSSSGEESDLSDNEEQSEELQTLRTTAEFLTAGEPFRKYIERVSEFLKPGSQPIDPRPYVSAPPHEVQQPQEEKLPSYQQGTGTNAFQQVEEHVSMESRVRGLAGPISLLRHWTLQLKNLARPQVKEGYRRIEWQCDCGVELYADFHRSHGQFIDKMEMSLRSPGIGKSKLLIVDSDKSRINKFSEKFGLPSEVYSGNMVSPQDQQEPSEANKEPDSGQKTSPKNNNKAGSEQIDGGPVKQSDGAKKQNENGQSDEESQPEQILVNDSPVLGFLALCVNVRGIYKILCEIGVAEQSSDAAIFLAMKSQYLAKRSRHSLSRYFVKPATVEYIQFRIWNFKESYISVCQRPNCIPPPDSPEYRFQPRSLIPPPMPPEVFIHYLEHGEGDLNPNRNDWIDPLPKRVEKHTSGCFGYGIHIIEKPNWLVVGILTMAVLVCDIAVTIAWSVRFGDVQGGTGIGTFIIACYTALLGIWVYSLGGDG